MVAKQDGSLTFHEVKKRRPHLEERIWVTKEGDEIPYDELDPGHLINILMWMRRRSMERAQKAASKDGVVLGPDGWLVRKQREFDGLLEEARRRRGRVLEVAELIASRKEVDEDAIKRTARRLRQDR